MPFISTTVFQDSKPSPNTMLLDNRINGLISKILKNGPWGTRTHPKPQMKILGHVNEDFENFKILKFL